MPRLLATILSLHQEEFQGFEQDFAIFGHFFQRLKGSRLPESTLQALRGVHG